MNKQDRDKAIRLYESGLLQNTNCFANIPEITAYQQACKEFTKQQEMFEEFLYCETLILSINNGEKK